MLTGLTRNLSFHNDKKTQRQNRKAPLDHCISKDPRPQYLKTGLIYAEEGFIISCEFNQAEDEPLNVISFSQCTSLWKSFPIHPEKACLKV